MSQLPVLPNSPETKSVAPVILVTPALAPWLYQSPSLWQSAMGFMFQKLGRPSEVTDICSVAAVVDRLPLSSSDSAKLGTDAKSFEQSGSEGMALLFPDVKSIFGLKAPSSRRRDISSSEPEPTLVYGITSGHAANPARVQIATPVANTIFSTGQPHTLIATRWQFSQESAKPSMRELYNLANCRIESAPAKSTTRLAVPLRAITQPKRVITSMGNVISQLAAENGGQKGVPASTELEKILPEYVRKHNLENQRLAVWALVKPENTNHKDAPAVETTDDVSKAIASGSRLHRVMGGGGGWGKKQGLLSLDPEYVAATATKAPVGLPIEEVLSDRSQEAQDDVLLDFADELPSFLRSSEEYSISSLSSVAKPGDHVQFFVAPLDTPEAASSPNSQTEGVIYPETRVFGVIPTSDTPFSSPVSDNGTNVLVVQNHFGVLSNKAITFSTSDGPGLSNSSQIAGTKIDVPGARVVIGH